MPTERLHLNDSLLLEFDARVLVAASFHGTASLVLDRTAFYPESGGQLGDRGAIRIGDSEPIVVKDVQADDADVVHHIVDVVPSGISGLVIRGIVDEVHRRDSMSQHTAQHMLSRAFLDAGKVETVSARLGSETSTIDLNVPVLDKDLASAVEQRVNDAVLEDRLVRVLFPTAEELPGLKLWKAPTVDHDIRVVEIEAFDAMPCGGTHCQRTGQVGPVIVTGHERYKGLTRVTFVAGKRALRYAAAADALLRSVTSTLTCTRAELTGVVGRLKEEGRAKSQALGHARSEAAKLLAQKLLAQRAPHPSGTTWIAVEREGDDIEALRALASALASRADVVALVSSVSRESEDRLVVVDRGSSAETDAGKWFKAVSASHGGRGGGRREHAEGRVPAAVKWAEVTASLHL